MVKTELEEKVIWTWLGTLRIHDFTKERENYVPNLNRQGTVAEEGGDAASEVDAVAEAEAVHHSPAQTAEDTQTAAQAVVPLEHGGRPGPVDGALGKEEAETQVHA